MNVLSGSVSLQSPTGYLQQQKKSLELLKNRLISAQNRNISAKKQRYVADVSKLDAMSPLKVLTRGYVTLGGYSLFRVVSGSMEPTISTGALLIEIGNNRNTLSEALAACPIIAEALERAYRARN